MHRSEPDGPTSGTVPDNAGLDLAAARRRVGGDDALLRELAVIFIDDAPELLAQAQASVDTERARRAAHSLKGLASNFSESTATAAQAVEEAHRSGDTARLPRAIANLSASVERLIGGLQRDLLR